MVRFERDVCPRREHTDEQVVAIRDVSLKRRPEVGVGHHLGLVEQSGCGGVIGLVEFDHLAAKMNRTREVLGDQLHKVPGSFVRVGE